MQDLKILVTQKTAYKWNTTVFQLSSVMLFFSKKRFLKVIKAPLRVENTVKKSNFCDLTETKIRDILEDKAEWIKLTETRKGKLRSGVIPYLTGFLCFIYIINEGCKGLF